MRVRAVISNSFAGGGFSFRLPGRVRDGMWPFKEALADAGYKPGDRVIIMTAAEAKELDRAWKATGEE